MSVDPVEVVSKACTKCAEVKPLDEFGRRKASKKDGRQARCKACLAEYAAEYHKANRDKISERNSKYYAEYYRKNRAARAEHNANYRAENKGRIAERMAEYRRAKPHAWWGSGYRIRAKRFGFDPIVEPFTRDDLINRYGDQCFHCGGEWAELDHYPTPVRLGGAHTLENAKPSCVPCNRGQSWRSTNNNTVEEKAA